MNTPQTRIALPGFGLPIDTLPSWSRENNQQRFPHPLADHFVTDGVTLREARMLGFIAWVSDVPGWDYRVFDGYVLSRWREKATRYDENLQEEILSEAMFDYCISELQDKALRYRKTGFVAVLDADATVVRSDSAVSDHLRRALRSAVRKMEKMIPEPQKDWHPGSNNQVLDLVHPSLFPLVFGTSKALPSERVPLHNCARFTTMGETVEALPVLHPLVKRNSWGVGVPSMPWGSHQWLPAQVDFAPDGRPRIASYINNMHPQNTEFYGLLEKIVDRTIPLWDECLSWFHDRRRIRIDKTSDDDWFIPEGITWTRPAVQEDWEEIMEDSAWARMKGFEGQYREWWETNRRLKSKEPEPFVPFSETVQRPLVPGANPVNLRSEYKDAGLQIVFKLSTIHLTPDKPQYDGSGYHVEGVLNDHICATAFYYFDERNIESSKMSFLLPVNSHKIVHRAKRGQWSSACTYYGIRPRSADVRPIFETLTPKGRLLAFPNVFEHRVVPFGLADPTKPGYRKVLAMYLVDPHTRVLSTANVPPQSRDWWAYELRLVGPMEKLPEEMFQMVMDRVDSDPPSLKDAAKIRERMIEEWKKIQRDAWEVTHTERYNFRE